MVEGGTPWDTVTVREGSSGSAPLDNYWQTIHESMKGMEGAIF